MITLNSYQRDNIAEIINLYHRVFTASEGEQEGQALLSLTKEMLHEPTEHSLYCFVANEQIDGKDKLVGAIIFSKVSFDNSDNTHAQHAYILSPVAVETDCQGKGVGSQLINYGIEQMKALGAQLLFTYGDPNYYGRFGYQQITEAQIKAPQQLSLPHGWLCQALVTDDIPVISEKSACIDALNKAEYW